MSIIKRGALLASALLAASLLVAVAPADAGIVPTTGEESATLTITKVVQGEAPADAIFVIEVDCENIGLTTLAFDSEGGSDEVVFFSPDFCTITEVETGGAVDVTPPQDIAITEPILYSRTVTNVFDTAPSSSTTESVQADAAVRPTFTG